MIRAFIVKLDVVDPLALQEQAAEIQDILEGKGLLVESVAPWKGHGMMTSPLPPPLPPIV